MSDVNVATAKPPSSSAGRHGLAETASALVGVYVYHQAGQSSALESWASSTFGFTGFAYPLSVAVLAALMGVLLARRFGEFASDDTLTVFRVVAWSGVVLYVKHGFAFTLAWLDPSRLPDCVESAERERLYLLMVLGAAPLAEELLFRVLLLGGMTKVMPAAVAVPTAALVYTLAHDQYPLLERSDILVSGLLLGMAWQQTRSLGLVLLIHLAMNLVSVGWLVVAHDRLGIPLCSAGH